MKIFKIRDNSTGLFSTGGHRPRWTKKGKNWTNIGHVKNHINNLYTAKNVDNWVVIEYELVETTVSTISVRAVIEEKMRAEQQRELERQQRILHQKALKARAISKLDDAERKALGL
jgi:hypothetical protein